MNSKLRKVSNPLNNPHSKPPFQTPGPLFRATPQMAGRPVQEMSNAADLLAELKASDAAWIVEELDADGAARILCDASLA